MDRGAGGSAWPEIRCILKKCLARAGSGGLPGAMAGLLQVVTLMWLRTIVNYQCRYGTSIGAAASELYRQGGVLRFYRGVVFALVSNPLSRFGMAAANEGAIALTDALPRQVKPQQRSTGNRSNKNKRFCRRFEEVCTSSKAKPVCQTLEARRSPVIGTKANLFSSTPRTL